MIIVSDTSPIHNLAAIHQLDLLQQLYETVIIPEAVYQELTSPEVPVAGGIEVQTLDWIQTRSVRNFAVVKALGNELDPGEAEAIALALELEADSVLIDERRGRMVAERLDLHYTGIIGLLVEAKSFAEGKHTGIAPTTTQPTKLFSCLLLNDINNCIR